MAIKSLGLFSGNANRELAEEIAHGLGTRLGAARLSRFSDGEMFCQIEENVRGVHTYVIQPTCSPVNEHLMELLIMVDALRRASAGSITAVLPYYGYARQDRKMAPRTPISSRLVADLMQTSGVSRVLCVDLHAAQIQGFFTVPVDHLFALPVFLEDYLRTTFDQRAVFVSPDAGGVERARAYSKRMGASLAIIDKRRARANESEVMHLIGDVKDRDCIIVDDLIDTGGTLCNAARAVMDTASSAVRPCSASTNPRWTRWSSPTRFPRRGTASGPPRSSTFPSPGCWRRPSGASTRTTRSARFSSKCPRFRLTDHSAR